MEQKKGEINIDLGAFGSYSLNESEILLRFLAGFQKTIRKAIKDAKEKAIIESNSKIDSYIPGGKVTKINRIKHKR